MSQTAISSQGTAFLLAGLLSSVGMACMSAEAAGPGLPRLTFASGELGKPLSYIQTPNGLHGTAAMHKGYLTVIFSQDGSHNGGFAFYDISNPRQPKVFATHQNEITKAVGESHGWSLSGDVACLNADEGLHFWDWSDPAQPVLLSYLKLAGITVSDYDLGAWWTCWQGSYVYVGGAGNGIYVVEATDPKNPRFIRKLPTSQTGGFRVGPVFAIGNLLVATNMDQAGLSTFNIGDPENPQLLSTLKGEDIYACMVNGNRIIGAGLDGSLKVYDIADPSRIRPLGAGPVLGTEGGYTMVQDGYAFMGFAKGGFAKLDITQPGKYTLVTQGGGTGEQKFVVPLGNMLWGGCIGNSSPISVHQTAPDEKGPEVNMVNPTDQSSSQPRTSRVGLTFTDMIDLSSVTTATFTVRKVGGAPLPGKYALHTGIVNFAPSQPFEADAEYEIVVPAGGIKDWSGNPVSQAFTSRFSTGRSTGINGPGREKRTCFPHPGVSYSSGERVQPITPHPKC